MIGWLAGKIYEALFTDVDSKAKKIHIVVKIAYIVLIFYCVGKGFYTSLIGLLSMLLLAMVTGLSYAMVPALIVSSIPALWLSLSNALVLYLTSNFKYMSIIEVYVRSLTASLAILLFIVMLSPYELSRILYKLGFKRQSLMPVMMWRLTPLALKDVVEAYSLQRLRRQPLWKSIAISTASMLEKSELLLESNGLKLETGLREPLPYEYSVKYTVLLSIIIVLVGVVLLLF